MTKETATMDLEQAIDFLQTTIARGPAEDELVRYEQSRKHFQDLGAGTPNGKALGLAHPGSENFIGICKAIADSSASS